MQGEMIDTEEHIHLAITAYKASDGAGLVLIHNEFASSATAQDYFEKVMRKAQKTIERGEKKDKAGNVVGVRAEAIVPTGPSGKPMQAIVLTFGGHFYEIQCDSPSTSRALEMRLTSSN